MSEDKEEKTISEILGVPLIISVISTVVLLGATVNELANIASSLQKIATQLGK